MSYGYFSLTYTYTDNKGVLLLFVNTINNKSNSINKLKLIIY